MQDTAHRLVDRFRRAIATRSSYVVGCSMGLPWVS